MTLRRNGTRRIVVGDVAYHWTVAPNDEPGLGIVVEHESGSGQRMVTWMEHETVISPRLVRDAIQRALDAGWRTEQPGSELSLRREVGEGG